MSKFLSGRQSKLKLGVQDYTESKTVLQTTGKVGIGTTDAQAYSLFVVGSTNITGISSIAGNLTVGKSPYDTSPGHLIRDVGHLVTRRDGAKAPVYSAYDGQLYQNNIKIQFENDGSAFFMNSVGIGTTNVSAVDSSNTSTLAVGIVTANQFYGDGSNLLNTGATLSAAFWISEISCY